MARCGWCDSVIALLLVKAYIKSNDGHHRSPGKSGLLSASFTSLLHTAEGKKRNASMLDSFEQSMIGGNWSWCGTVAHLASDLKDHNPFWRVGPLRKIWVSVFLAALPFIHSLTYPYVCLIILQYERKKERKKKWKKYFYSLLFYSNSW